MVLMHRASQADFTFIPTEYSDEIRVLRFSGVEEISRPFCYRLKLAALDSEIDFGTIIGKTAYLRIAHESGERYVNGIITRFIQAGTTNRYTIYHAELVPIELLLSMRHSSRIFQQKSVQEIITDVLSDIELQSDQYRFALQGNHPSREFCVQYRESDLNFISRLMEEEGIFYFFEHDDEKHVIVMADDPSVHVAVDSPNIPFNPASGMVAEQECIYSFRFIQQIRPNSTVLRDFNYEDPFPTVNLMGLDTGTDYISNWFTDQELEFYDYPGGFMDRDRGDDIAQIRMQSLRQNVQVANGNSVCRRLIPGYKFTLEGHSRSNFNQEYMITRVETSGSQPLGEDSVGEGQTYNNNFECIPASVTYRPPRRTPKPIVEGVQTAMVVGPSGSDIYTDDLGRVKVEFHWDRDESQAGENRSCWVRVSHGYAGEKHGIQFTPLINDEVIVDFLEGDPDRPIITGRVYNFVNFPHLNSSDTVQNLILTPYQHRLLLDDKKASITLNTGGGQNLIMTDGSKESINNISLYTSGNHKMIMSDGAQKIEIRSTGNYFMEFDDKNQVINVQSAGGHHLDLDDAKKRIGMVTASGHQFTMNDENNFILHKTVAGSYIGMSDQLQRTDLKTSGGHRIRMNDQDGKIEFTTIAGHKFGMSDSRNILAMQSVAKHRIIIDDNTNTVDLADGSNTYIVNVNAGEGKIAIIANAGNIELTAPAGTIKIEGLNVEITAKASLKLSGTTTEVKGTATNQIKGGMIQMGPPT
jgi:type VI secretion system VgrG family protein